MNPGAVESSEADQVPERTNLNSIVMNMINPSAIFAGQRGHVWTGSTWWVRQVGTSTIDDLKREPTIFLLRECESEEEAIGLSARRHQRDFRETA